VLLLVLAHPDDGAVRDGQQAEPVGDRGSGPRQCFFGGREHFVAGREVELRIGAQAVLDRFGIARPEDAATELGQLGIDPGDLVEPDPVDLIR
jgi:hypothetical protein